MDLAAIHQGLADLLNEIPDVRAFDSVPDNVPLGRPDLVVVIPDEPYIEYSIPGAPVKHDMYVTLRIIPQPTSTRSVQQSFFELLSAGTEAPRSVYDKLAGSAIGRTANQTACQAYITNVSPRVAQVNGEDVLAMDMQVRILARS